MKPIHNQKGQHNSPEHESLRAVVRCLALYRGPDVAARGAARVVDGLIGNHNWRYGSDLTPHTAWLVRKELERYLPECVA